MVREATSEGNAMTDEECIATVLLHGGKIWWDRDAEENHGTKWMAEYKLYFAIEADCDEHTPGAWSQRGRSPGEVARKYCEHYGLLREVTDAAS
jgi:hypothetical protein